MPPESGRDNKIHSNYKPQNTILIQKYIRLPEFRCSFLQGRELRNINKLAGKSIKSAHEARKQIRVVSLAYNPNQIQGNVNKYNNTDDETKDEGDNDKAQSREDQNELEEKLLENKNDKMIVSSDHNPKANANSK